MASSPGTSPSQENSKTSPPPQSSSSSPPSSSPPASPQSSPPAPSQDTPSPSPPANSPSRSPPSKSSPPHKSPSPPPHSSPPALSPPPPAPEGFDTSPPPSISAPPPPTVSSSPKIPGSPRPAHGSPPSTAIGSPPPTSAIDSQAPPSPIHSPASESASANHSSSSSSSLSRPSASPQPSVSTAHVAVIAGVVGGGAVLLAAVIVSLICKRRRKHAPYYMDRGRPAKGGELYYSDPPKRNNPQTADLIVNLTPLPGKMENGGGWGAAPAANVSNDISSSYAGQHHTPMQPPSPIGGLGAISQFTHEELATATNGFSQANLLGQGGFGFVHKGVLSNGKEVAIKSLKSGSGQGEREFQAEVEIISRVHHRHLVSLVGYCIANGQRMLAYEFVPNQTLEFHLHGKGRAVMDWATRVRIAVGSAKGLAYLHEDCHPRIIHRDIKAANILLDYNFEAMVADFGLAKLTSDNYTHVSTRVMGTFGYLAPEYASSGKLTEKSDVFSFGVMLLELITGRRPVDPTSKIMEESLVDWARPRLSKALEDGNFDELVDPRLLGIHDPQEIARMAACAAASIRHSARRRPKMSQIVRALEGDSSLEDLNEGVKPGQSSLYNPNGKTEAYDTGAYNADMAKFRKKVMSSEGFNSSEYGTSDNEMNSSSGGQSREIGNAKS